MTEQNDRSFSRRDVLKVGAAAAATSLMPRLGWGREPTRTQPNVVFVFADQWRRHAAGVWGEDKVLTPNVDRFAAESRNLRNALSGCPLCSPYRASLMTGRYPQSNGVITNCSPGRGLYLHPEEVGIAEPFVAAGYETAYIGKWHLDEPSQDKVPHIEDGATGWDSFTPPGGKRQGWQHWFAYNTYNRHWNMHHWRDTPEKIHFEGWGPSAEVDEARRFLRSRDRDKPFFMMMSWHPPHPEYRAPEELYDLYPSPADLPKRGNYTGTWPDRYNQPSSRNYTKVSSPEEAYRNYMAACTAIDRDFAALLSSLDDMGLRDDTIVVLTADHGDMLGSHGQFGKTVHYEESINVPFMIRWPGHIAPARDEHTLIDAPDIMPTLLGLAGLNVPAPVEGENLAAVMRGERTQTSDVRLLQSPRDLDTPGDGWRGLRTRRGTYYATGKRGAGSPNQWTDLREDPLQLNPIEYGNGQDDLLDEMHERLIAELEKRNDPAAQKLG